VPATFMRPISTPMPHLISEGDKQVYEYRAWKLYRAGFSDLAAQKIAAEVYFLMDSDEAIKLLRKVEESKVFVEPELAVLFFLGLVEEMPKKN